MRGGSASIGVVGGPNLDYGGSISHNVYPEPVTYLTSWGTFINRAIDASATLPTK